MPINSSAQINNHLNPSLLSVHRKNVLLSNLCVLFFCDLQSLSSSQNSKPFFFLYLHNFCSDACRRKEINVLSFLLSGGGRGGAQQGGAAAGGAQNDAVQGKHVQPPGVHPGRPTVALEHQAFHHLPGRRPLGDLKSVSFKSRSASSRSRAWRESARLHLMHLPSRLPPSPPSDGITFFLLGPHQS